MKTNKLFYSLLVTQTLSLLGSRMTSIGVGIWVFTETGKTAPLLLTSFFNELPGMLAGSLAGVIVDRVSRRILLMLTQSGGMLLAFIMAALTFTNIIQEWHVIILAALLGRDRARRRLPGVFL